MKLASVLFAFLLAACGSNLFGNGNDGGTSSGSGSDAGGGADAAVGAGCTGDLGGGTKLCTYISLCPTLAVDHDQFPNCGFRIRGEVIDIECICNETMLCPMGAPTTCTQANTLMQDQNEILVCQQVDQGLCTKL